MGDEVAGFGTVYMMTEDGEWEQLGDVANWDMEIHADSPYLDFAYDMFKPQEVEFVIDGSDVDRGVLEDVFGKPDGSIHFDTLMVRQKVKVPRSTLLFLRALGRGDDAFRNYMKAVKRSLRNTHARR